MDFQCPVKYMGKHLLRKGEWLREAAVAVDQMTAVDKVLGNPVLCNTDFCRIKYFVEIFA